MYVWCVELIWNPSVTWLAEPVISYLRKGFEALIDFLEILWDFQASAFHNTSKTLCTINYFNLHIL